MLGKEGVYLSTFDFCKLGMEVLSVKPRLDELLSTGAVWNGVKLLKGVPCTANLGTKCCRSIRSWRGLRSMFRM